MCNWEYKTDRPTHSMKSWESQKVSERVVEKRLWLWFNKNISDHAWEAKFVMTEGSVLSDQIVIYQEL